MPETALMHVVIRKSSVRWKGRVDGSVRAVTTQSGVLKRARFSPGLPLTKGSQTDPAELIAAAHASSFALALSRELRLKPSVLGDIITTATVTLEYLAAVWTIVSIHLDVTARLPGITQNRFIDAIIRAKTKCPVTRLLRATISMNARLER